MTHSNLITFNVILGMYCIYIKFRGEYRIFSCKFSTALSNFVWSMLKEENVW